MATDKHPEADHQLSNDDITAQARPLESRRSTADLSDSVGKWLAGRPDLRDVEIIDVVVPESNGMSSETFMVTAAWISAPNAEPAVPATEPNTQADAAGTGRNTELPGVELAVPTTEPPVADPNNELTNSDTDATQESNPDTDIHHEPARDVHRLVFRIAPDPRSMPVFEGYDLWSQFMTMRAVARHTAVPVPHAIWFEADSSYLGSEFFVMERCDGEIPPDVLPYNFGDTFLFDAAASDQYRLQTSSVRIVAALHDVPDPIAAFSHVAESVGVDSETTADSALRHHVDSLRRHYTYVTSDGLRSPLMEAAFEWIDGHWPDPSTISDPVFLWGDARIGNVIYRDFEPVAVLDWEMATIGPRELDISWMIFMHQFFEDVAAQMALPGMPAFMARDDVCDTYRELTGYTPRNMGFYAVVSALQHAIIMSQIGRRAVAFGGAEMPADIDDLIMHRKLLSAYMT